MILSKTDIQELKVIQPELVVIGNQIAGRFYLSASLGNKKRGKKINCHPWNCDSKDSGHIVDDFDVDVILDKDLCPATVFSRKILPWKDKIPEEFWHVYLDGKLCLGVATEILEEQKKYSFAEFISILLMQYFYYLHYTKRHKKEPWKTHRHGLFYMLEVAFNSKYLTGDLPLLCPYAVTYKKEWSNLLNKTQQKKVEGAHNCPFCHHKKLAKNCSAHKEQIEGYNKLMKPVNLRVFKSLCQAA